MNDGGCVDLDGDVDHGEALGLGLRWLMMVMSGATCLRGLKAWVQR